MPITRDDYFPSADEWRWRFQMELSAEQKEIWWSRILVGEDQILGRLTRRGVKCSKKRLQKILDSHTDEGEFVGGDVFSPFCGIDMVPYKGTDKRHQRLIPVCWKPDRLEVEWLDYQRRIKTLRLASNAACRHHGSHLPPPELATNQEMLTELGYIVDGKATIEIRPEYDQKPAIGYGPHRFEMQGRKYDSLGEAITDAIGILLCTVMDFDVADPSYIDATFEEKGHHLAPMYYVCFGDNSLAVRRVVSKNRPTVHRHRGFVEPPDTI